MPDTNSCVSVIVNVVLDWLRDHVKEYLKALVNLEDSKKALVREMEELKAEKDYLERDVKRQESPILERTDPVRLWMERVNELRIQVDGAVADFYSSSCFPERCAPGPLWRRCKIIKTVPDLLGDVRYLRSHGKFEVVVTNAALDPDRGVSDPPVIDEVETMNMIRECLDGDQGIVGIYGMGGVGKSTLVEKIHFYARGSQRYDCVMRVVVPREERDPAAFVRKSIAERLGHPQPEDKVAADAVRNYLGQRSFLLLLDNLWKELNPSDLGVPVPDGRAGRKILFATRLKSVCDAMGAHAVKVNLLQDNKARDLFQVSVGNSQRFDVFPIQPYVDDVISECGGLPLALKIVGRVMASMVTDDDWRDTAKQLKEFPAEIPLVEEKVFNVLRFSFLNLNDKQRECLLFCALFPDKHDLDRKQLVEYWIAEGLLHVQRSPSLEAHHRNARNVTNHLMSSCLLEKGSNAQKEVRMHDVVRDVALWIAAERFLVSTRWSSLQEADATSWKKAQRISIMHSEENLKLPKKPTCSSLSTLLIRHNSSIEKVPEQFFSDMPELRVLDFSGTKIEGLPGEIGKLSMLRYLNLSHTVIRSLPPQLGDLKQLRHLDLSYTAYLRTIPRGVLSSLSNLWVLNMFQSRYDNWEIEDYSSGTTSGGDEQGQHVNLGELEGLTELQEFGLNVKSASVLDRFLMSRLLNCTTRLYLVGFLEFAPSHQQEMCRLLTRLQELHIGHFARLSYLAFSYLLNVEVLKLFDLPSARVFWQPEPSNRCCLRRLEISECNELMDLDWIKHLRCLETISLSKCHKLQQVVKRDDDVVVKFHRLKEITLQLLPNLESICRDSVRVPILESLKCWQCPNLTNLPFQRGNAGMLDEIHGDQDWWDGLHWESEADRLHYSLRFKQMVGQQ